MKILSKKVDQTKERLIKQCEQCKGNGCPTCFKQGRVAEKLAQSNIPVMYWFLKLADFSGPKNVKQATINYVKTLNDQYTAGKGLVFTGNYGTGKTTAACSILKNAVLAGYTSYYTTLNDLVQYLTDNTTKHEFYSLVTRSDWLAIDEVDSRHFSDSEEAQRIFGSNFERVVRYRVQNQLPTIIASNNATIEEVFKGQYRRVVESLLHASSVVPSLGKDQRKA